MAEFKETRKVSADEVRTLFEALLLEYSAKERLGELAGLLRKGIPSAVLSQVSADSGAKDAEPDMDLHLIIDLLPDAVLVIDRRGRVTRWNRAMEKLTGVPAADMLGRGDYEYALPFYGERRPILVDLVFMPPGKIEKKYIHIERRGSVIEGEAHVPDLRGREARLLSVAAPLFDPAGRLLGAVESVRDITRRRKAEEALLENERLFRTIFENMEDIYCRTDQNGRISMVNPSGVGKLGCGSEEDVLGRHMEELLAPEDRESGVFDVLHEQDGLHDRELSLMRADGTLLPVAVSCRVLRDEAGRMTGIEGILRDITERRRSRELENARLAAEAANTAKSEFLASMSHEIRTPLNAILGMAELLSESSLGEEERKYVRILQNAGQGLMEVINDILDLSKVEAGHIELENVGFDLPNLVESVCEIMAVRAHEKGLELRVSIAPETPSMVSGDPGRLKQVLVNLLGNALKFTDRGEIEVTAGPTSVQGETAFTVRDTGAGIPEERQQAVFERFVQADASVARTRGGTGLGLPICKRLVELMGGEISLESELGHGSTFRFTARFNEIPDACSFGERFEDLQGCRVLVVDDNPGCLAVREKSLKSWGAGVETAASGPEALSIIEGARIPFHGVILDADMPGMDGFETAHRIRELTGSCANVIFLFTTLAGEHEFSRARELGAAGRLIKPACRADLHELLLELAGRRKEPERKDEDPMESLASTTEERVRPLDILLVEDNESNRALFAFFLKDSPHRIEIAENGLSGVEKCLTGNYDVVFMDIEMPVMNGLEAASAIRGHEEQNGVRPVPIIALSAHVRSGAEQEAGRAGCTGYLTKPFDRKRLLAVLAEFAG